MDRRRGKPFRGIAVEMLRRRGYGEWVIAVVSSLLFGLMHALNFLGTDDILAATIYTVYTFFFGIMMYLTPRVTGNLIWPMLLHASTDPSQQLVSAASAAGGEAGPLAPLAAQANIVVIAVGIVLVIFIRGRVGREHYGLAALHAPAAS